MQKVTLIIAHNTSVPYFIWLAELSFVRKDVEFSFIALNETEPIMSKKLSEFGCLTYWIKFSQNTRKRSMIKSFFKLYFLFKTIKPDIVHTNLFDDSLPGLLAAKFAGVKKRVITKQDTFFHWNFAPQWVWADRFNNFIATHIHSVSTNNYDFIINKEKARKNKVFLVRNGFKYDEITKSSQISIDDFKARYNLYDKIVIGTVARFIEWKGHRLIIEAAKEIVKIYPHAIFLWVGYHPNLTYQNQLKHEIKSNKLEKNIIIIGYLERYLMPSFYQCLDIYLHPAINEPFGFAISEALMNEIPVITTRTGSSDLMEHMKSGYIIDMNNSDQIVVGLTNFITQEENRKEIALNGKEYAIKELQFEKMYYNYLKMYSN